MTESKKLSADQFQKAYEVALQTYGGRDSITGIDIGYKYKAGQRTEEKVIRFHVREKIAATSLETATLFPEEIAGVSTDVIQAIYKTQAEISTSPRRKQRLAQIQPGLSVAHKDGTAGTFGAVVYDGVTGQACILSNWHILVGRTSAEPGDPIVQPGPIDGGRHPQDTVATLERSILGPNGDAAIARLNETRTVRQDQYGSGVIIQTARMPRESEILEKSGRTTGVTQGRIDGQGRYFIDYAVGRVGIDGFKLVAILDGNPNDEEISAEGDSGAIWYDPQTKEGVGLNIAGETSAAPSAEHAVACYLPRILETLNISLTPILVSPKQFDLMPGVTYTFSDEADTPPLPASDEQGVADDVTAFAGGSAEAISINQNKSPYFSDRGQYQPEAIVIHIAEGSFKAIGNWFKHPDAQVSAHYGVGHQGQIDQYVDETKAAWHAGRVVQPTWPLIKAGVNPNRYTIGIEHEGFADTPWTEAMYRASAVLVRDICQRWNIPLDRRHIIGHREIRGDKTCPGSQVDLDKLISLAKSESPSNGGKSGDNGDNGDNGGAEATIYIVKHGDTLWGIAHSHGTTVAKLVELNPELETNPSQIFPGQKIKLPA